jgi:hypothetical protein
MAYPSVAFKPVSQVMGIQPIDETSAEQRHALGMVVKAFDQAHGEGEFIYLRGVASTVPGDVVCYDVKAGTTVRAVAGGASSGGPAAVAMSANEADRFGWYQVSGSGPVRAGTVAGNASVHVSATAGQADDGAGGGSKLSGAVFRSADADGYATVQMDRPSVTLARTAGAPSHAKLFLFDAPLAPDADAVHGGYAADEDDGGDPAGNAPAFTGDFTNPDVPRTLTVTFGDGWDGGDVEVFGTSQFGEAISEVFGEDSDATAEGERVFATVTGATKAALGSSSAVATIGTGTALGIPEPLADDVAVLWADGTAEAGALDVEHSSVDPTTPPDDAAVFTLLANVLG